MVTIKFHDFICIYVIVLFRLTPPSRPNEAGLSVRLSTKSFCLNKIRFWFFYLGDDECYMTVSHMP